MTHVVGASRAEPAIAPLPEPPKAWASGHSVQLYESEEFLASSVAGFLAEGVAAGQPVLIIATADHARAFLAGMRARRVDVDELVVGRDILVLDAQETLDQFMRGASPDPAKFEELIGQTLRRLAMDRPYVVVRAYGEMVDLLWRAGNIAAAMEVEELWNDIALRHSFDLLCAYAMQNFASETHSMGFLGICDKHQRVLPTEAYLHADESQRLRQIAVLQQRALALEAEVRHRRELEGRLRETLEQRRRVEEEFRRRELELRDFLENGLEPMHWVGPNGIIQWANRAELEMLGYARDEYLGQHIARFHVDQEAIQSILARLARGEELRNHPARLRRKDGTIRQVLLNSNVLWQDGKFVHTRCFSRDISDVTLPIA